MSARSIPTRGQELEARMRTGVSRANRALAPGARDLPVLRGITPTGLAYSPVENVRAAANQILAESGRVFLYGDSVVFVQGTGVDGRVIPLTAGYKVETTAITMLANLFTCELITKENVIQFAVPGTFLAVLLNSEPTRARLPRINLYATRPVFDADLVLYGPGWHPQAGVLVHGPHVEPTLPAAVDPDDPVLLRLPHHLRMVLRDFCFRGAADVVNAVAAMLTGLLMARFLAAGKAVVLLDGTQPGLGKTLLARVVGMILDGIDPHLIHFTSDDEELAKRICATLRGSAQSIVLIDNAKVQSGSAVSSPVIEANSMAREISLRILGVSSNYVRPNDLLWFLTMNDTRTSPDLVSRGLPIRFAYEGNPAERDFEGRDPLIYAEEHRTEILGELMGLVLAWMQGGCPTGTRRHRCATWAGIIGGILEYAGLSEVLGNLDEAAASFDAALDELTALAESAVAAGGAAVEYPTTSTDTDE